MEKYKYIGKTIIIYDSGDRQTKSFVIADYSCWENMYEFKSETGDHLCLHAKRLEQLEKNGWTRYTYVYGYGNIRPRMVEITMK